MELNSGQVFEQNTNVQSRGFPRIKSGKTHLEFWSIKALFWQIIICLVKQLWCSCGYIENSIDHSSIELIRHITCFALL